MHVIAKPVLVQFWTKYTDSRVSLMAWHRIVLHREFSSFNDLRKALASADQVNGLTVFNIVGNKHRLIAAIHYNSNKVYIRNVLTRAEYDLGKWKKP
jgi:mRNA interferase HigB